MVPVYHVWFDSGCSDNIHIRQCEITQEEYHFLFCWLNPTVKTIE